MAKRSRANRTEKATYQNIRNEHKYIDVVHHGDGHYYIIQYIKHELPERTVVNYMGTRCGHKQKFRIGKGTLLSILEDYKKKDYSIVEHVYTWHPSISEVEGKEQIAELYKSFGMPIIKNMMEAANYAETLDRAMAQAQRQVEELRKRIIRVAKGDLVVEQCITEAKKLFETVNDPHEWDVAVSYLKKRYGADAVDEAIKIEHLEM